MINVTVNLPDGKEVQCNGLWSADASQAIAAAKLLYPDWTSIVLTIVKNR